MPLNRPNIIKRFIGVSCNVIIHKILMKNVDIKETRDYYLKEVEREIDIALSYRNQINPVHSSLPDKDVKIIENKIKIKVNSELNKRIKEGYDIDFSIIDKEIKEFLKENNIC